MENAANQSLYIKDWIFRNILLLSCVLPFVLYNTRAYEGICEPCCYCGMQRSERIYGWSRIG